jgi:hypothetical protein
MKREMGYYCQVFHFQCLHIVAFSFCIHKCERLEGMEIPTFPIEFTLEGVVC